jgi:hypothetical protein
MTVTEIPVTAVGTRDIPAAAGRVVPVAPDGGASDHDSLGDDMTAVTIATDSLAEGTGQLGEAGETGWRPTVPGNAGHPLDDAPLPYWLEGPCPPWCHLSMPHKDSGSSYMRQHESGYYLVSLTLEDPHDIEMHMEQDYREREPHVSLILAFDGEPDMTLAEAAELTRMLKAVAADEGTAPGKPASAPTWRQGEPCPAWCDGEHSATDEPRDRRHAGECRRLILTMMQAGAADAEPPFIAARLEQGWREAEARIVLVYADQRLNLTRGEAREMADDLSGVLADAGWLPQ